MKPGCLGKGMPGRVRRDGVGWPGGLPRQGPSAGMKVTEKRCLEGRGTEDVGSPGSLEASGSEMRLGPRVLDSAPRSLAAHSGAGPVPRNQSRSLR